MAGLAGCHAGPGGIHQVGVIDPSLPSETRMIALPPHLVAPTDELEINVRPPDHAPPVSVLVVQADGTIDLGFAGDVFVQGVPLAEVEARIAHRLNEYAAMRGVDLIEPLEVSARLAADGARSRVYYVLGAVGSEGRFLCQGNETVLDAILEAGLRSSSQPERAYLVRPQGHGGPDRVYAIDWRGIVDRGDPTTNYQVLPGDRIHVPGGHEPGLLSLLFGGPGRS